jgi:UDP-2,3-diacylglucosamine hydrolase
MQIEPGKNIYFLSDFHLGVPDYEGSLVREKKVIAFLESIRHTAAAIFVVGDMFDFWYEYKTVVPKGYTRLLGLLASLTDSGIPVHFFIGNHDMWMSGYFEKELNIPVYREPKIFEWNGKSFFIGHGDGLGPGDHKYKMLKKLFRSRTCQWLFGLLHPDIGVGIANYFSRRSRIKTMKSDKQFYGEEREWLIVFCKKTLTQQHYDYFIFGHRHYPLDFSLANNSRYINLGDWIRDFTYAVFDGTDMQLKKWEN